MNVASIFGNRQVSKATAAVACLPVILCIAVNSAVAQDASSDQSAASATAGPSEAATALDSWSRWRGPTGNGIAEASQKPPTKWDANTNVVWKTKVPGMGHSSPIVVGQNIFMATADSDTKTQSVLCYDRTTGEQRWATEVNKGGFPERIHPKNTHASSTVAVKDGMLFSVFFHHGRLELVALDFSGKIQWRKDLGQYVPNYPFGYGPSPIIHEDLVIVPNENKIKSALIAIDINTQQERWRIDRTGISSYSTPVIAEINGAPQLLISGGQKVSSYNPDNGQENWSTPATWQVTCGTLVWDDENIYASGGFPTKQTLAINATSHEKIWDNRVKAYEQSMLLHDGYLYAHGEAGAIHCWKASTGEQMWKQRFGPRNTGQDASPVYANGHIYFLAENGECLVIEATPKKVKEVSRNQLGNLAFASPAFCGNQIFLRVAETAGGSRQEYLYCLGEK